MADMIKNILPVGIECVFVRQKNNWGLATQFFAQSELWVMSRLHYF